jgi:hypothetical protein
MVVMVMFVLYQPALAAPMVDSLLFAVALAVGLSPEFLPAIVSIACPPAPAGWEPWASPPAMAFRSTFTRGI